VVGKLNMINIPDKISIEFQDSDNKALFQENVLVGIKTFATHKNDIDISPFATDKNGTITIYKQDLQSLAMEYISLGLMDYTSLDSAKENVEIYFIGVTNLEHRISYLEKLVKNSRYLKQSELWGDKLGKLDKEMALIEKRNVELLKQYTNSFNLTTNVKADTILIADKWDTPELERHYVCRTKFI
jgi:hypothetical protein